MSKAFKEFHQLHHGSKPLLIGNVWNVQSAKVFEKLKFKAIATSSAAVAETLGYADGEEMSFEEYYFIINRIARCTALPLSVDIEAGYGSNAGQIADNIRQLHDIGVAGINIEDSVVAKGKRSIADSHDFAELLTEVVSTLSASRVEVFINVRCDAYLLDVPSPTQEAINRIKRYEETGVHGIFLPCITQPEDIKAVVTECSLPVNVMCMPGLPDFDTLRELGVKRISMGNFSNKRIYAQLEKDTGQVLTLNSFASFF